MNQIEKNTVKSDNQVKASTFSFNESGTGTKVLFVGNSITLHGILPDIGWHWQFGMAASAEENDYVHLIMKKFTETDSNAVFKIAQVAKWEREYKNGSNYLENYKDARDFNADIIIMRFIENCPHDNFDNEAFKREYIKLLEYFNPSGKAKVVITTSFWKHKGDSTIMEIGEELGYPVIYLGDLGEDDEMKAIGLFEHSGVANHPGDKGMATIAERIMEKL